MPTDVSFAVLKTAVRPGRVLLLVPDSLPEWERLLLPLAEYATSLWAGRWNAMPVPVSASGEVPAIFEPLVRRFDPDHVVSYEPGLAAMRDVGLMLEHVEKIREGIEQIGVANLDEEVEEVVGRQQLRWEHFADDVALGLNVRKHANPFAAKYGKPWVDSCTGAGQTPNWPLTTWDAYLPTSHIMAVVDPASASDDPIFDTLVAWSMGRLGPSARESLRAASVTTVPWQFFDSESMDSLGLAFGFEGLLTTSPFYSLESALGGSVAASLPRSATLLDAAVHTRSPRPRDDDCVVVVGDELEDFLLWVAMSRLRSRVLYAPRRLLTASARSHSAVEVRTYAGSLMLALQLAGPRKITLTSATLDSTKLGHVKAQLRRSHVLLTGESPVDTMETVLGPPTRSAEDGGDNVVLERDPFTAAMTVPIDSERRSFSDVALPTPRSSSSHGLGQKRWIAEIELQGRHLPPSPALASGLFDNKALGEEFVRITGDGTIAVWHPHWAVWGDASMAQAWTTGYAGPPDGIELVRSLVGHDYDVRPHDKGRYASAVVSRLGMACSVKMFESAEFAALASLIVNGRPKRTGSFAPLSDALAHSESWTNELLTQQLATIAHLAKCAVCSFTHVLPVDKVELVDTCNRCGARMSLARLATEPLFREQQFLISEVLRLVLEHRADAVVSAFSQAVRDDRHPEYVQELELRKIGEESWTQLDIVAIAGGEFLAGEVKTGSKFGTSTERRSWRRTLSELSESLTPVRLRQVHAWTSDFSESDRRDLRSASGTVEFVRIPARSWH